MPPRTGPAARQEERPPPGGSNPGQDTQPLIPDSAELKLLRRMELDLRESVDALRTLYPDLDAAPELDPAVLRELTRLAARHERVTELFRDLRARGVAGARLYDARGTGVGGTRAMFVVQQDPRAMNLPPDPIVPADRLRAAEGEEDLVEVAREDLGHLLPEPGADLRRKRGHDELELRGLLVDRIDHPPVAVADVHGHQLAVEVEDPLALRRVEGHARGAVDRDRVQGSLDRP